MSTQADTPGALVWPRRDANGKIQKQYHFNLNADGSFADVSEKTRLGHKGMSSRIEIGIFTEQGKWEADYAIPHNVAMGWVFFPIKHPDKFIAVTQFMEEIKLTARDASLLPAIKVAVTPLYIPAGYPAYQKHHTYDTVYTPETWERWFNDTQNKE